MSIVIGVLMVAAVAAQPAAAVSAVPSTPAAQVASGRLDHPVEKLSITVPATATYLGAERFNLYGVADAEIHVFAEGDEAKNLKKLYWIQFESYLPSRPDARYDYGESDRRTEMWGTTTWLRSNPVPTTGEIRPGSDREVVFRLLRRSGYTIPPAVMNVRMVQLLDDPKGTGYGRRELMIIYSEDLGPTGRMLADLRVDGKPTAAWEPIERALIARASASIQVTRR